MAPEITEPARDDFARTETPAAKLDKAMRLKPAAQGGAVQLVYAASVTIVPHEKWPAQIRGEIDLGHVAEIAASIAEIGITSYPRARMDEELGGWVPVVGAHRMLAIMQLGWMSLPLIPVPADSTELDILEWQLADQESALPLKFSEKVAAVARIHAARKTTNKEIAARLKMTETDVSNDLASAQLPLAYLHAADDGLIPASICPHLARCKNAESRHVIFERLRDNEINRDQAVKEVQESNGGTRPYNSKPKDGETGKPDKGDKVVLTHKSKITFRYDPKHSFQEFKAAISWANRQVGNCNTIDELRAKLNQPKGEAAPKPASDGDATVEPEAEPEEQA